MKKQLLFFLVSYGAWTQGELILLDRIEAIVYHPQNTAIILLSDLGPGIDGVPRTIQSEADDHLIVFDAQRFQQEETEEGIENYFAHLQKENGLSRADLEAEFGRMGHTFARGREWFRRSNTVGRMKELRVKSKIVVDAQEVEDYYTTHEPTLPTRYTIQCGSAHKNTASATPMDPINRIPLYKDTITWDEPLVIAQNELALDKQFVVDLPLQEIACLDETGDTLEFIRVIDKEKPKKLPLQDQYQEIELILKKTKYDQALQEYKDTLRKPATIVYSDPTVVPI